MEQGNLEPQSTNTSTQPAVVILKRSGQPWLWWILATSASQYLCYLSIIFLFPMNVVVLLFQGNWMNAWGFLIGSSLGAYIGTAQFIVLRMYFPGHRWISWIPLTVVGFSVAYGVTNWMFLIWEGHFMSAELGGGAFMGLMIGGIQAPFLYHRIRGRFWWVWMVSNILAWMLIGCFHALSTWGGFPVYFSWPFNGLLLGVITGYALLTHMRGTAKNATAV